MKIMPLYTRYDYNQMQLMPKNRSKQDQQWKNFKFAKVLMTA